jgi:hypothetical protein
MSFRQSTAWQRAGPAKISRFSRVFNIGQERTFSGRPFISVVPLSFPLSNGGDQPYGDR